MYFLRQLVIYVEKVLSLAFKRQCVEKVLSKQSKHSSPTLDVLYTGAKGQSVFAHGPLNNKDITNGPLTGVISKII